MDLMDKLRERAAAHPQKVAFFAGDNPKISQTVAELTAAGLAECVLVGDAAVLRATAEEAGVSLEGVAIVDTTDAEGNEAFAQRVEAEPDCPFKPKALRRRSARPMDRALLMQRRIDAFSAFFPAFPVIRRTAFRTEPESYFAS